MDFLTIKELERNGEFIEKLQAIYDNRQSFYGKASVYEYNNILYLVSYDTIVAKVTDKYCKANGWYSQTTARHINEFFKQHGFEAKNKKELDSQTYFTKKGE